MKAPAVTLIVATVERTVELDRLFASLAAQTFRDFDIIVVDQNVDNRLLPYLDRARNSGLVVRHIRNHPANLSAARNVGIAAATGRWVGFPDDDCWYENDLLERLRPRFESDMPLSGAAVQWAEEGVPPEAGRKLTWERSKMFRDIPTASFQLFFHRGLFAHIGDFDCRLGVGLFFGAGEETDLILRALRAGALLTYEPAAKVHHPIKIPAPTPQARLAMRHRQRGAGALWVKHRLPAWVIIRGLASPLVRPLLKGSLGADLALGYATFMGRLDGLIGWKRTHS